MSWTPKPGEKVTSPLLVGEWEVVERPYVEDVPHTKVTQGSAVAFVEASDLSPVAPPLPPEPPVGSVVWAKGRYWMRTGHGEEWHSVGVDYWQNWSDLATADDFSAVVAVSQVADWLRDEWDYDDNESLLLRTFVERFGWPDE